MIKVQETDGSVVGYVKCIKGYWAAYNAERQMLPGLYDSHIQAAAYVYERAEA